MTKKFCIAGPINPEWNYFLPHRLDREELCNLIEDRQYFVLHAPRQSGKTTGIKEFVHELCNEGRYHAIYVNIEAASAAGENAMEGIRTILSRLLLAIKNQLENHEAVIEYLNQKIECPEKITLTSLLDVLNYWSQNTNPKKSIVLFIDEIDSLIGDTLLSVLRQIRTGFDERPDKFPQSICLIGLRDVRDYRIWSKQEHKHVSTSSPFNIKAKSLVLNNFSEEEIGVLLSQHTQETGQIFQPEATKYIFDLTWGQPWLVNALAYQAVYTEVKDRSQPITKEVIERAKEALIKRRDTHLDSLLDKLQEPRVKPIIELILTGETDPGNIQPDDLQYVRDLGLVRPNSLEIANPIYREIIPRELTSMATDLITQAQAPFVNADGSLNTPALIEAFVTFFRENSEIWLDKFKYKEAGPHLLLMAFLQRVINGGGVLTREYALGRRRVDILLKWLKQIIVIELKIRYSQNSLTDGLKQTAEYMTSSNAGEGHLILFDRDPKKSWDEKIFYRVESTGAKTIHVWGC